MEYFKGVKMVNSVTTLAPHTRVAGAIKDTSEVVWER